MGFNANPENPCSFDEQCYLLLDCTILLHFSDKFNSFCGTSPKWSSQVYPFRCDQASRGRRDLQRMGGSRRIRWELAMKPAGKWVGGHLNYSQVQLASPGSTPNLGVHLCSSQCLPAQRPPVLGAVRVDLLEDLDAEPRLPKPGGTCPRRELPRCSAGLLQSRDAAWVLAAMRAVASHCRVWELGAGSSPPGRVWGRVPSPGQAVATASLLQKPLQSQGLTEGSLPLPQPRVPPAEAQLLEDRV